MFVCVSCSLVGRILGSACAATGSEDIARTRIDLQENAKSSLLTELGSNIDVKVTCPVELLL